MKILWTLSIMFIANHFSAMTPNTFDNFSHLPAFNEQAIEERLLDMNCLIAPKFGEDVTAYLRRYLTYGYRDSEYIIGRSALYFPMIEHYLKAYNLPEELKFLPIIESNLKPYAVSTAGAAGLWQVMPITAKELGLKIDAAVDERCDPHKSTLAALSYLKELFEQFGSWELALAGYNAGAGNVRKAIRLANSKDFWRVKRFLPRETQQYIPRFIAATYVMKHYYLHGLTPMWPDFDRQWTRTTRVFEATSFKRIVEKTGVSWSVLKELNPAYRQSYLPTNENGNFLILPDFAMDVFQDWKGNLGKMAMTPENWEADYYKTKYTVLVGDSIHKLAQLYECSVWDIMEWNGLTSNLLYYRQELILYHKKAEKGEKSRA